MFIYKIISKALAISILFLTSLDKIFSKTGMSGITLPNWTSLDKWVFENFMLADEPFAKALQISETCVSVNNNLSGKLLSSLELLLLMKDLKLVQFHFLL